jgi:hypothetical protein
VRNNFSCHVHGSLFSNSGEGIVPFEGGSWRDRIQVDIELLAIGRWILPDLIDEQKGFLCLLPVDANGIICAREGNDCQKK